MGLLNPIWLWGLTGLMIPVAIHLLSRKDMRIIQIGSLRHLVHSTTRQAIRIRLNAYGLLALRCLIVALLVLLLAELYLRGTGNATRWLVFENGLEQTSQWKRFTDSLKNDGFEVRRLQRGFPLLNYSEADHSIPDYWALAQQLSRVQPDRCFVISRDRATGFAGVRTPIDSTITWLTASPDSSRFVIAVNRSMPDTVIARVGRSNEMSTIYESVKVPTSQESSLITKWTQLPSTAVLTGSSPDTMQLDNTHSNNISGSSQNTAKVLPAIQVVISGTNILYEERRIVEAAIQAISSNAVVPIQYRFVEPGPSPEGDWLIWLSSDEPPASNIASIIRKLPESAEAITSKVARPLLYQDSTLPQVPTSPQSPVSHEAGTNTTWITRPLTLSTAVREQFTLQLATVLLHDSNHELSHAARAYDQRVMSDDKFSSKGQLPDGSNDHQEKNSNTTQREGGGILALIIALLFACERFIASRQQL